MDLMSLLSELRFDWLNLILAILWGVVLMPLIVLLHFRKGQIARIRFSSLRNIKKAKPSMKVRLRHLPFWLRITVVAVLLAGLSHPFLEREKRLEQKPMGQEEKPQQKEEQEHKKIEIPTEGISIQLLLDRSGSMGLQPKTYVFRRHTKGMTNYVRFEGELMSKMDVVKTISQRFIKGTPETSTKDEDSIFTGRGNDMIGLFTFARYPLVACPLTLRHELLMDYISQLDVVTRDEENGTYIGYALQRCILQIVDAKSRAKEDNAYNIKSSIIILITDGQQSLHKEDESDKFKSLLPSTAAKLAQENGIKVYTIAMNPRVIYDDQGTATDTRMYAQFQFDEKELKAVAQITGGKFFSAQSPKALEEIYREIDQLEKSEIPVKKELEARVEKTKETRKIETEKIELFVPLLWLGLAMLLLEIALAEFYFRRIP